MPSSPSLSQRLRERARRDSAIVALPEADDARVVTAARIVADEGIARPLLIGDLADTQRAAADAGVTLDRIDLVDPVTDPRRTSLARRHAGARPGIDLPNATELAADPLWFAAMLVDAGGADGLVAGARTTTADTIEPALQMRRLVPGMGPIASCFLMELPSGRLPDEVGDVVVFADCALNPLPSSAMLARIAMAAAAACRELCGMEPRVGLLSSSTKGSATNERIEVVRGALDELARRAPDLTVDGELQVDAALFAEVGRRKSPDSPVAGRANVLVFPDLESGNIGYKLVERLAGARAIGPLFSGLNWPINDLSRGCDVDTIVDVVAVTAIQASTP